MFTKQTCSLACFGGRRYCPQPPLPTSTTIPKTRSSRNVLRKASTSIIYQSELRILTSIWTFFLLLGFIPAIMPTLYLHVCLSNKSCMRRELWIRSEERSLWVVRDVPYSISQVYIDCLVLMVVCIRKMLTLVRSVRVFSLSPNLRCLGFYWRHPYSGLILE